MIYTFLLVIQDVTPDELKDNETLKKVPDAIHSISMGKMTCKSMSQHIPALHIHPFDPEHIPPYDLLLPLPFQQRCHDVGYIYIETEKDIPSPMLLVSALNDLPEFVGKLIFLSAEKNADPVRLMKKFIGETRSFDDPSESIIYLTELYELALNAHDEAAALIMKRNPLSLTQ